MAMLRRSESGAKLKSRKAAVSVTLMLMRKLVCSTSRRLSWPVLAWKTAPVFCSKSGRMWALYWWIMDGVS